MNIGSRIAAWFGGKKLPYDAEVEYLRVQDGSRAYLEFGDIFDGRVIIADCQCFGSTYGGGGHSVLSVITKQNSEYAQVRRFGNNTRIYVTRATLSPMTSWADRFTATIDTTDSTGTRLQVFCLFGQYYTENRWSVNCYGVKAADGSVDLIPVRKDGFGYMYDRVSGQLFGNAGTGAFVIGPDKV